MCCPPSQALCCLFLAPVTPTDQRQKMGLLAGCENACSRGRSPRHVVSDSVGLDRGQITCISDRFQVVLRKDAQRHQRATTELGEGHLRVPPSLEPPTLMGFGEERTLRAWVGTEGCHRGQESLCLGAASRACAAGLVLSPSAGGPHWSVSPRKSC